MVRVVEVVQGVQIVQVVQVVQVVRVAWMVRVIKFVNVSDLHISTVGPKSGPVVVVGMVISDQTNS